MKGKTKNLDQVYRKLKMISVWVTKTRRKKGRNFPKIEKKVLSKYRSRTETSRDWRENFKTRKKNESRKQRNSRK